MNIATGKLDAPVEKQASILDAITEAGTALAKFRGAGGEVIPHALSAGLGAGTQQVTNRLLRGRLYNNPKLLKALELGSATALGGGAGFAGALAAPLSRNITQSRAGSAARQIAELTAMGSGAELALTPALTGLGGGSVGAVETLSKMLGGGALALGGQVAKDRRNLSVLRNLFTSGARMPRGINPRQLNISLRDNIAARYKGLGIPEGGVLGATGLGLMSTGNPYLGATALLAAPLKNSRTSKYMGDLLRELRAGSVKATEAKKTKDVIDGLYKKSSHTIKLAAPVYQTHYCLDAPTMDKVALIQFGQNLFRGGKNLISKGMMGAAEGLGKGYQYVRGSRLLSPAAKRAQRGRKKMLDLVTTQNPNLLNPAEAAESALLQATGKGSGATTTTRTGTTLGSPLKPLQAPTSPPPTRLRDAFSAGREQVQYRQRSQVAKTQEGYDAYTQLGTKPTKRPGGGASRPTAEQVAFEGMQRGAPGTTAPELAQQALTPATAAPTRTGVNLARGRKGVKLSDEAITQLEGLPNAGEAQKLLNDLDKRAKLGSGASTPLTSTEKEVLEVLRSYSTGSPTTGGNVNRTYFANLKKVTNDARKELSDFTGQQTLRSQQQTAIGQSPLTAPVRAGERATASPSAITQDAVAKRVQQAGTDQRIDGIGGLQGVFQYRPAAGTKGKFTSVDEGLEIANIRFNDSKLADDLIAVEGKGGLSRESLVFQQGDVRAAQQAAAKDAQLHTAAAGSRKATEKLTSDIQLGLRTNPEAFAEVEVVIADLAKQSGKVDSSKVIAEVNKRLAAAGKSRLDGPAEAAISAGFSGKSGQAFSRAQTSLDDAMLRYNGSLEKNLESSLNKVESQLSKKLSKRVEKLTGEKSGVIPTGRRQRVRSTQEINTIEEIQALAESRARILRDASIQGGGTIAARTQAAELIRITEEALRTGSSQELIALRQTLANPSAAISTRGGASKFTRLLDTTARNKTFNLNAGQEEAFRNIVQMEGRGAGDQVAAVRQIFSTTAARSPESPAGRELAQVLTRAETSAGQGELIANLGRQEGAGQSAFGKLTSGNPAGYQAQNYTVAELEAIAGTRGLATPSGLKAGGRSEAVFEQYIVNGRGTIQENAAVLDQQITRLQRDLRIAGGNTRRNAIKDQLKRHQKARAHVDTYAQAQQQQLDATFQTARNAEQGAKDLISADLRAGNVTLLNDVSKIQQPKGLDLGGAKAALEEALTSDPAQHSSMVNRIFRQVRTENPAISPEAVSRWMVENKLVTSAQMEAMGGARQLAQGMAAEAGRGGLGNTAAGVVAAGGIGTLAAQGGKPGPATQGRERITQGSWGLSPLHAPVMPSKLAAQTMPPIPLEKTKAKLPDFNKIPAKSLLTATVQGLENATKHSSLLSAPVGAY